MDGEGMKIGMTPSHPGISIRTEVPDELGLSVTRTAEVPGGGAEPRCPTS